MDVGSTALCLIGAVIFIVILFVASAIKVVPEYQRLVVFRLGRCVGARGPGIVILIPVIDRSIRADLREQVLKSLERAADARLEHPLRRIADLKQQFAGPRETDPALLSAASLPPYPEHRALAARLA